MVVLLLAVVHVVTMVVLYRGIGSMTRSFLGLG